MQITKQLMLARPAVKTYMIIQYDLIYEKAFIFKNEFGARQPSKNLLAGIKSQVFVSGVVMYSDSMSTPPVFRQVPDLYLNSLCIYHYIRVSRSTLSALATIR